MGQRAKASAAPHTQRVSATPGTALGQGATVKRQDETLTQVLAARKIMRLRLNGGKRKKEGKEEEP